MNFFSTFLMIVGDGLEYGFELKFFDNRFGIDFTYFDREDSN